jgi:hypothetical protein
LYRGNWIQADATLCATSLWSSLLNVNERKAKVNDRVPDPSPATSAATMVTPSKPVWIIDGWTLPS